MKKSRPWTNKEWLYNQYHNLGKSQKEIAVENDTGTSTICRWMKFHKIEIRPVSQELSERKKKFWSNEENKEKYLRGDNNPARREDVKKKLSKIVKGHWDGNEKRRSQMSEWSKSSWNDERKEFQKNKTSELNIARWSDQEYREKMSNFSKRTWNDTAYAESAAKIALALKSVWDDPEFRERASDRARAMAYERLKDIGVGFPSYNKNSISIIEGFAASLGEHVQHAENGGEVRVSNYWLDGYISNKNIAIEYDEPHHFKKNGNLLEKDIKRMKRIHKEIGCTFVRIKYDGAITVYNEQWFINQENRSAFNN